MLEKYILLFVFYLHISMYYALRERDKMNERLAIEIQGRVLMMDLRIYGFTVNLRYARKQRYDLLRFNICLVINFLDTLQRR